MSADSRPVTTDALETLGSIISEKEKRDAIHLAVEPVVAAHDMDAGAHVGLMADGRASELVDTKLGIVDPFLSNGVAAGERFWLVVYPRQITSLRHVWEHPSFPASVDVVAAPQYSASEQWIRDFANSVSLHYDVLMDGAAEYVDSRKRGGYGEYLCFGELLEGESVPDEFWTHYDAVTGNVTPEKHRGSFFACSC